MPADFERFSIFDEGKDHQMFMSIRKIVKDLLLFLLRLLLWCVATICSLMETLEKPKQREEKRFKLLFF